MSSRKKGSYDINGKNMEKASSASEVHTRYKNIIHNLTADQHDNSMDIESIDSFSRAAHHSNHSFSNSMNMLGEGSSEGDDNTPEEIKQYVIQFKEEVEQKFSKSKSNREFKVLRNLKPDDEGEDSLESLREVERYDLNAQNIGADYRDMEKIDDSEKFAEILLQIGRLDKASLARQLKSEGSRIKLMLMKCLRSQFEEEYRKRRKSKISNIEVYKRKLEAYKDNTYQRNEWSSNGMIRNTNDSSESEIKKLSSRTLGKKRYDKRGTLEYGSLDKNLLSRFSKKNKDSSKSSGRDHLENKGNMKSVGSLSHKNRGGSNHFGHYKNLDLKKNGNIYGKHSQKGQLLRNINGSTHSKGVNSPRRKTKGPSISKSKHISLKNRPGVHYYNKNGNSPAKTFLTNNSKNNLSKRSNMTLFTNNTLTSTLSPKSNISLSTLKSHSRSRGKNLQKSKLSANHTKKANMNKISLLQFKVSSQMLSKMKKGNDAIRSITPSSQLVRAKLKKYGGSKKKDERYKAQISKKHIPKKKHNVGRDQVLNALRKKKDYKKFKKGDKREPKNDSKRDYKKRGGIAQLGGQQQNVYSLSNLNWRRRLENLM